MARVWGGTPTWVTAWGSHPGRAPGPKQGEEGVGVGDESLQTRRNKGRSAEPGSSLPVKQRRRERPGQPGGQQRSIWGPRKPHVCDGLS